MRAIGVSSTSRVSGINCRICRDILASTQAEWSICQDDLSSVVPLENASMPGRVVVQWDKDDCAEMGLIKVDLLGLGMMAVLQDSITLINGAGRSGGPAGAGEVLGRYRRVLAGLPAPARPADRPHRSRPSAAKRPGSLRHAARRRHHRRVSGRIAGADGDACRASSRRVSTISSCKLPSSAPGPIVGQMVHPYLNRRAGLEPVIYDHPSLEPVLARTLGVPLFQEQLLRMAMAVAGFTGGQAEELRRAMGFKRSEKKMRQIEVHLREGMARNGITGEVADRIVLSITSFALYGFPESHAASFALLAYASAYLKAHFPAAFYTALLNNQPMGFYHPATLVKDAQRRGVRFAPVDVQVSDWDCFVETMAPSVSVCATSQGCVRRLAKDRERRRVQSQSAVLRHLDVTATVVSPGRPSTALTCPKCGCDDPSLSNMSKRRLLLQPMRARVASEAVRVAALRDRGRFRPAHRSAPRRDHHACRNWRAQFVWPRSPIRLVASRARGPSCGRTVRSDGEVNRPTTGTVEPWTTASEGIATQSNDAKRAASRRLRRHRPHHRSRIR